MTPWLDDGDVRLYHGDCLEVLRQLPDRSVHMCATSPPFYGLRDYGTGTWEGGDPDCGHIAPPRGGAQAGSTKTGLNAKKHADGSLRQDSQAHPDGGQYRNVCGKCGARRVDRQIGLEETPDQWVERLVAVFREVRRVLRDDGTLWVEIGDSYMANQGTLRATVDTKGGVEGHVPNAWGGLNHTPMKHPSKPKDLLGQPWLLAFALRADGWFLRSEIIWARPNPMPESVTDRPTKAHSTVFLLSKQPRYFYDADAIREQFKPVTLNDARHNDPEHEPPRTRLVGGQAAQRTGLLPTNHSGANARSVWTIPTEPTPFAHFATWPQALVRRMVLAGTSERGCCPVCGAPWVRESVVDPDAPPSPSEAHKRRHGHKPSCKCDYLHPHAYSVPCTVLDPFAGSGTTLLVARHHGRHSIGIELNENYCRLVADRTSQQSLLTGDAA